MPKSRKRPISNKKSKKIKPTPYQVVKQEFVRIDNPIPADIPFEERINILREIGKEASINFETAYQKLVNYFNEYDPLYLCSFSSRYFAVKNEGIDEEAINGCIDFPDFFLEILQCFLMNKFSNLFNGDGVKSFSGCYL